MPTTINGIGTHYYGKRNVESRVATCAQCGRVAELTSYDTSHWVCVLFIPVIPLGKQRIINHCAVCSSHGRLSSGDWEKARAEGIRDAQKQFDADPDDPAKAVTMHATLENGGERDAAEKMAAILETRFGDDPDVLLYLGGWHEESNRIERSNACFHRAMEVAPDHEGARQVSMVALLREGKPLEANERIKESREAGQSVDPTFAFQVAQGLHAAGESEAAGEALESLTATAPEIRKNREFRKLANAIESRTGKPGSLVPPRPAHRHPAWGWSAAAIALASALFAYDRHVAGPQSTFVVNGLPTPLVVRIDDEQLTVQPNAHRRTVLSVGDHEATIIEPAELAGAVPFEIQMPRWRRWFRKPAHVVDPTHSAVVVFERTAFTSGRARPDESELAYDVVIGETASSFPHADYQFTSFPRKLEVDTSSGVVYRSRVGLESAKPVAVVSVLPDAAERAETLDYLEAHLRFSPNDEFLLGSYASIAMNLNATDRAVAFLESRLDSQPPVINWHRIYQSLAETLGAEGLKQRYDELLAAAPESPALNYLRGRLENQRRAAIPYYERCFENDADFVPALIGAAYIDISAGDFAAAAEKLDRVERLEPENTRCEDLQWVTRVASGGGDRAASVLQWRLKDAPLNYQDSVKLVRFEAARGRHARAAEVAEAFIAQVQAEWPDDPTQLESRMRIELLLQTGDAQAAAPIAENLASSSARADALHRCAIHAGDAQAATETIPGLLATVQSPAWLYTALIAQHNGDADLAARCVGKAAEWHQGRTGPSVDLFQILSGRLEGQELADRATGFIGGCDEKAAMLLLTADRAGPGRESMIRLAKQLAKAPSNYQLVLITAVEAL